MPVFLKEHVQIGAGEQGICVGFVFQNASVTYLSVAEQPLHDQKHVLCLASCARDLIFDMPVPVKPRRARFHVVAVSLCGSKDNL